MRRALVIASVLAIAPRARGESAFEVARATGHLMADDDLYVDRGWWTAPLDGGAFGVSTRFAIGTTDTWSGRVLRWDAELVVQIPFERFFARRPRAPALFVRALDAPEEPMSNRFKKTARWGAVAALPGALAIAGGAAAKGKPQKLAVAPITTSALPIGASAAPAVSVASSAPPLAPSATAQPVTPPIAPLPPQSIRALVAAALKTAGLDRDDVLDDLATRARVSALAPEVRLRAYRGLETGARVARSDDVADRWTGSDGASTLFEGRLSWRLDRLVFADEEVAIERIRLERLELKQRLTSKVIDLALRWQRARRAASDPELLPVERDEAAAITVECLLALDAMTGGAASSILFHHIAR
ncbi:MAG: hypothetical protein HYV09_28045 [Deltaproteobacteria bacterium]|nr:hypothetical protein [Deltaproteobacteria bacterium]